MSDSTFDPKTIFETYRNAFAPTLKAQQEGVKAHRPLGPLPVRRCRRLPGVEPGAGQGRSVDPDARPSSSSKQVELTTALSEKLRARAQEFVTLATDAQTSAQSTFTEAVNEATAKFGEVAKKKAG